MAVTFATFEFTNRTGLEVTVDLEAPVGTPVDSYRVAPNSTKTFNPSVDDVGSALVTVSDGTHDTTQQVGTTGAPYGAYIETLRSEYSVGSIRGEVRARY